MKYPRKCYGPLGEKKKGKLKQRDSRNTGRPCSHSKIPMNLRNQEKKKKKQTTKQTKKSTAKP